MPDVADFSHSIHLLENVDERVYTGVKNIGDAFGIGEVM